MKFEICGLEKSEPPERVVKFQLELENGNLYLYADGYCLLMVRADGGMNLSGSTANEFGFYEEYNTLPRRKR